MRLQIYPNAKVREGIVVISRVHLDEYDLRPGCVVMINGEWPARVQVAQQQRTLRNARACQASPSVLSDRLRCSSGAEIVLSIPRVPPVPVDRLLVVNLASRGQGASRWLRAELAGLLVCPGETPVLVRLDGMKRRLMIKWDVEEEEERQQQQRVVGVVSTMVRIVFSDEVEDVITASSEPLAAVAKQEQMIRRIIKATCHPDASASLQPPRGAIVFGPPGCGKSALCALCCQTESMLSVKPHFTKTELRSCFTEASRRAPCIILIDDVEVYDQVFLGVLIDALPPTVALLSTTVNMGSVNDSLLVPSRLGHPIEVSSPTQKERYEIFLALLTKVNHNLDEEFIKSATARAHGYVGADLKAVLREAQYLSDPVDEKSVDAAFVTIAPSAMREVAVQVPNVRWDDIGGQEDVKQAMKEAVEWPLTHAEAFERMGISPPRGVLLYGPPGCSKTLTAKALATEASLNFLAVKGPELFSKWVGESEKAVKRIFARARAVAPSILFFDEIDALASKRGDGGVGVADRVLSQMLVELDGISPLTGVVVVAATNRPDVLDDALLRPGRFDRLLYVGLPTRAARVQVFQIHLKTVPVHEDVSLEWLADSTEGYTGAECAAVCQEAGLAALAEDKDIECVTRGHFAEALSVVKPQISPSSLKLFEDFKASRAH